MKKLLLKIGFNTGIQVFGKVISVSLGLLTVILITRYLGAKGYGDFTLVFTYVSFFSVISDFGLQIAMVRELTQSNKKSELYSTFLFLKILWDP